MKKLTITSLLLACFALTSYSQEQVNQEEKQKPKATYQVGAAKVTVWENKGENRTWKNFKVEKIYMKGDQWKTTNSFDLTELLQLKAAIDKAINEEGIKTKEGTETEKK